MVAFSFPYFFISFILSNLLKVFNIFKDTMLTPAWDEFILDDHKSKMEFRWFKFFIYYQVYFLMMIVFVAYVQWNLYQLRTVRYKCKTKGCMLIPRTSSPYPKDMRIKCSTCERIIPESKNCDTKVLEKFKNCLECKEDYCKNCWIVPASETQEFLKTSGSLS